MCPEKLATIETVSLSTVNLDWAKLKSVMTDGARNMVGSKGGFFAKNQTKHFEVFSNPPLSFYYIIHQQSLCSIILKWDDVISMVVNSAHFIRNHELNHRQFQAFLAELISEYGDLLYHSEVHWLSCRMVLERFFNFHSEIQSFLSKKDKHLKKLSELGWICDLAFLVDMTRH